MEIKVPITGTLGSRKGAGTGNAGTVLAYLLLRSFSHNPRSGLAGILAGLPRFMRYADVLRECFIDRRLYIGKERILAHRAAL